MSWTTATDLRAQVQRIWDRGDLLRTLVSPGLKWPIRLTLKSPTATDISDRFDSVRDWVRGIAEVPHVRLEWREWGHRVQGMQRLPSAAWLDSASDALAMLGKKRQADRYEQLWQQTSSIQPALLPWLIRRPLQTLELTERWDRFLSVIAWLQAHPRPGVYLRQVDVPGVDTKFIEANRGVLMEWLDLVLPTEAIDQATSGVTQFNRRYGFLDKPARVRFRLLDPALPQMPGCQGRSDVTLDAVSFGQLSLPVERVFITENETNFLVFPAAEKAIVIFGAGYGWDALANATWLNNTKVHYWGDIDTHGLSILDSLRRHFPHVESFLMDRDTLMAHQGLWGEEPEPVRIELIRLTPTEASLYEELRTGTLKPGLRLEQERVGFGWLENAMKDL